MNPVLRRLRFRRFSTVQLLIALLVLFILRAPVVTVDVLCASISAYLMQRGVDHCPLSPLLAK